LKTVAPLAVILSRSCCPVRCALLRCFLLDPPSCEIQVFCTIDRFSFCKPGVYFQPPPLNPLPSFAIFSVLIACPFFFILAVGPCSSFLLRSCCFFPSAPLDVSAKNDNPTGVFPQAFFFPLRPPRTPEGTLRVPCTPGGSRHFCELFFVAYPGPVFFFSCPGFTRPVPYATLCGFPLTFPVCAKFLSCRVFFPPSFLWIDPFFVDYFAVNHCFARGSLWCCFIQGCRTPPWFADPQWPF